jgi:hypothetical protein
VKGAVGVTPLSGIFFSVLHTDVVKVYASLSS